MWLGNQWPLELLYWAPCPSVVNTLYKEPNHNVFLQQKKHNNYLLYFQWGRWDNEGENVVDGLIAVTPSHTGLCLDFRITPDYHGRPKTACLWFFPQMAIFIATPVLFWLMLTCCMIDVRMEYGFLFYF